MRKPITVLSILVVAALSLSGAIAEHFERRAQNDRFSIGDEGAHIEAPLSIGNASAALSDMRN